MKKILLIIATVVTSICSYAIEPTEKVLKAFEESFSGAKDVLWTEKENSYEVNFTQNTIKASITYDADGQILSTIRYYFGESLPLLLQTKISNKYKGKKIYGVTEVSDGSETKYHIILEDEKNWFMVQSDSYGNMYVDKKYKKA